MDDILLLYSDKRQPEELKGILEAKNYTVTLSYYRNLSGQLEKRNFDAVILDSCGKDEEWLIGAIELIKRNDENIPVIAILSTTKMNEAVDIMRTGAYDCLNHPLDKTRLISSVQNGIRLYKLSKQVYLLETELNRASKFDDIIGQSKAMQEVFQLIKLVSKSDATALILGESGTGKELVAKAIHKHSNRAKKQFVDINCGAIPHELLENELFGHERGSYTGADRRYIGSFERAEGGTVFLDEISEMDLMLQVKLLRFLQERTITRIGGTAPIKLDVRIVAATNKNLEEEVKNGRFREDLYYRLNVVPIHIAPLRQRREDISALALHFMKKNSEKSEKIFMDISPQALEALMNYDWPGNVRELENIIERVVVLHNESRINITHLPPVIRENKSSKRSFGYSHGGDDSIIPLEQIERYAIENALQKCLGNIAETARRLKLGQATLYRKIRKYGLRG